VSKPTEGISSSKKNTFYYLYEMKGINYLTNNKGKKTAIVIDLNQYQDEVMDFLDGLEASSRVNEPSVDFQKAVSGIIQKKKRAISSKAKKVSRERA
jgi:hypothetical protein